MDRQPEQPAYETTEQSEQYARDENPNSIQIAPDQIPSSPVFPGEAAENDLSIIQPDAFPEHPSGKGRPGLQISRRRLIVAGTVTAGGLAIASSLGILGLKELLRQAGPDILGSFRLGNGHRQPLLDLQGPLTTPQDLVIFSGRLNPGWNDWSWGHHQIVSSPTFTNGTSVIQFNPSNNGGLYFSHSPVETTGFGFLQFWINGGSVGGQQLLSGMADQTYSFTKETSINNYIQGGFVQLNQWRLVRIPLATMQSADAAVGGVIIRDGSGTLQPDVFLADLRLIHLPDPNEPVLIAGDAPDLNAVLLFFDRQMRLDEVQTPRFYQISSLEDNHYIRPVAPARAQYHATNKSVSLLVPASMQAGKQYTVSVGRIHSMDGPALADASSLTVTAQPLELSVDISKPGLEISPYIYGVSLASDPGYLSDLRPKLNRWGGEQATRYNWKLGNAFNAAYDYYFQNGNYGHISPADRRPSGVADQFIAANRNAGTDIILTIPTIGWVAKDDLPTSASINVGWGGPPASHGSQSSIYQGQVYDPTQNRRRTSVPSRARKGSPFSDPPNLADPSVAQDEWVYHLVNRFGAASNGGVRFYQMDNEYDLWFIEHRDVRPVEVGYDELLSIFLEYATAIKAVDPTALITGPVAWGWPNFFYSALDRWDNNFKTLPDYHAHHDVPLLLWWMQQVHQHDAAAGQRSLDVLDIHWYPQANEYKGGDAGDAAGRALRLRSTRSLWDPTYKDESWINDYVNLIPRMRSWISQGYPGTKLAISEYNWGGETLMNGALAEAEVLGIFGREGVDTACYWPSPNAYSPPYYAFKLYSNYDGQGSWFGGTSISATSTRLDTLSCYAAKQKNGDVLLMLLNKSEQEALTPTIHLPHLAPRHITVYRYGPDPRQALAQIDSLTLTEQTLRYTLPPNSITLLQMIKT